MIANNAKERLVFQMKKYNGPDWSPTFDDLHIFSILTTTLFCYDPIGIQNALNFNFSIEDIRDEYDIEAAALLRCKSQWTDAPSLGCSIKEVLDYYLAEELPMEDCLYVAEQTMPAIKDKSKQLDLDAVKNLVLQRESLWIPLIVE
ncbi:MAG: DUF1871 family protein [Geobacteraceae bacterium]|nr:DUF1871 family protein [Geobacteraceae bacterium]